MKTYLTLTHPQERRGENLCVFLKEPSRSNLVGVSHLVVHDTVVNGVHHFVVENGVHGGATDAAGNKFVFAYNNSLKARLTISLGDPTTLDFDTDHFDLVGPTGHLHVSFAGTLIFDASGNFVGADLSHAVGNVSCDPI